MGVIETQNATTASLSAERSTFRLTTQAETLPAFSGGASEPEIEPFIQKEVL